MSAPKSSFQYKKSRYVRLSLISGLRSSSFSASNKPSKPHENLVLKEYTVSLPWSRLFIKGKAAVSSRIPPLVYA
jgi:hypothetical protein